MENANRRGMNKEEIRARFKKNPKWKKFIDWVIMNQVETRPRWYVRFVAPLYQHRGKNSVIHRSVRMDTPPYRKFYLGDNSVIESFTCINNAVGDVIIGHHTRVGLHETIIGPVTIGNHCCTGQGTIITALIHNFDDSNKRINEQGVSVKPVFIEDDVMIGANASIMPGVRIGTHSIVAAGAVVTKNVPTHSLVAGVQAKVIKKI